MADQLYTAAIAALFVVVDPGTTFDVCRVALVVAQHIHREDAAAGDRKYMGFYFSHVISPFLRLSFELRVAIIDQQPSLSTTFANYINIMKKAIRDTIHKRYGTWLGEYEHMPHHPDAPPPATTAFSTGRPRINPPAPKSRRPPKTVEEVELAWQGLVRLFNYFRDDRAAVARVLDVGRNEVCLWLRNGHISMFGAIRAERVEGFCWKAEDIAPHITEPRHWAHARKIHDKHIAMTKAQSLKMKAAWARRK